MWEFPDAVVHNLIIGKMWVERVSVVAEWFQTFWCLYYGWGVVQCSEMLVGDTDFLSYVE